MQKYKAFKKMQTEVRGHFFSLGLTFSGNTRTPCRTANILGPEGPAQRTESRGGGGHPIVVFREPFLGGRDHTPEAGGKAGETLALASDLVGSQQVTTCVGVVLQVRPRP